MVPSDLIRALVPYNRVLGGRVGSPNPKFRFAARKDRSTAVSLSIVKQSVLSSHHACRSG
jgi:hypothetical protein